MGRLFFGGYSLICFSIFIYFTVFYSIIHPVTSSWEVLFWMGLGFVIYGFSYIPVLYWWLKRMKRSPQWAFLAIIPIFALIFAFYPNSGEAKRREIQKLERSAGGTQRVMRYGSFKDRESDRFR